MSKERIKIPFDFKDCLFFLGISLIILDTILVGEKLPISARIFYEEFFNCTKMLTSLYMAFTFISKWHCFSRPERTTFLSFFILVAVLATYNCYRVVFLHELVSYTFNMCYHLTVLTLYAGQLCRMKKTT